MTSQSKRLVIPFGFFTSKIMFFPSFPAQTSAMYTLQRRIRVLRDQLQKKDLQLELFKRKLTLLEEGARGKCLVLVSLFFSIQFRRALPQPASSFRSE